MIIKRQYGQLKIINVLFIQVDFILFTDQNKKELLVILICPSLKEMIQNMVCIEANTPFL